MKMNRKSFLAAALAGICQGHTPVHEDGTERARRRTRRPRVSHLDASAAQPHRQQPVLDTTPSAAQVLNN